MTEIEQKALELRREYQRRYKATHREKFKQYQVKYWQKKALQETLKNKKER